MIKTTGAVNIFFSCDDNYIPFLSVAIRSLIDNSNKNNLYHIRILNGGIKPCNSEKILSMAQENVQIEFVEISDKFEAVEKNIQLRDYYTSSIYYRLLIPEMFPQLRRAIYLDADVVILSDIATLFTKHLYGKLLAAVSDAVVAGKQEFRRYSSCAVGIPYQKYFNSGVMLMNLDAMRKFDLWGKFFNMFCTYRFPVICPDQDYLNFICRGRVLYLPEGWNKMSLNENYRGVPKLIHYNMFNKPWYYDDVPYGGHFDYYACKTPFAQQIRDIKDSYTEEDAENDLKGVENLIAQAVEITNGDNNFAKVLLGSGGGDSELLEITGRIEDYEKKGGDYFFRDVKNDPPSSTLMPDDVDYLCEKPANKLCAFTARMIEHMVAAVIRKKYDIKIEGAENLCGIEGGAIITSNHFSETENIAVREAVRKGSPGKRLYKLVREGNFFMPGVIGFLLRHCDTLPLSSNVSTMTKLSRAVEKLLGNGNFILIYPEQAMWLNYGKPRPNKPGAFFFAAKNSVPVIPCYVALSSNGERGHGSCYTVHVMPPIYPDKDKTFRENVASMQQKNYELCSEKYVCIYKIPLKYAT